MTDKEILRAAMKKRDYNQVILASEMGYGSQSSIAQHSREITLQAVHALRHLRKVYGFPGL